MMIRNSTVFTYWCPTACCFPTASGLLSYGLGSFNEGGTSDLLRPSWNCIVVSRGADIRNTSSRIWYPKLFEVLIFSLWGNYFRVIERFNQVDLNPNMKNSTSQQSCLMSTLGHGHVT
jgi:hypothetical protein